MWVLDEGEIRERERRWRDGLRLNVIDWRREMSGKAIDMYK